MSSASGSDKSGVGAMVSIDDRLVHLSSSEETAEESVGVPESVEVVTPESSGVPKAVTEPERAPANVMPSPSVDEAAGHRSSMTVEKVEAWREKYLVKGGIRIPKKDERACCPPKGYQCIYQDALEAGLRVPPHPFIVDVMNFYQLGIGQIVPNSWRLLVGFLVFLLGMGGTPSVPLFNLFFSIASLPGKNSWFYIRGREGKSLVTNPISSVKNWKHKFVFMKVEGMARSWNFRFVAPALKLVSASKTHATEVARLEAAGVVSASAELLSNESMDRAGVFDHGRELYASVFSFCFFV